LSKFSAGIIACSILQRELENILKKLHWSPEVLYLDATLHVNPQKMRSALVEQINTMANRVDVVFLGYGFCQSLQGIEEECSIPVILPQVDDCISLLLGPERYAEEVKKETGTWFMTPGWAEVGAEMVIKELHLDRVVKYGKDPMQMARRLFTHYRRGLLIDTGVGDCPATLACAEKFCADFNLALECTEAQPFLLEEWLGKAHALVIDAKRENLRQSP
jgi:hypothetical protein